jgi:hypothetical protein
LLNGLGTTVFIVKNISSERKKLRLFNTPIYYGEERNLLSNIVTESDIRDSLLKGILFKKLICNDIKIIKSNINLLQFDDVQKSFLKKYGITDGLEVKGDCICNTFCFKQCINLLGIKNNINRVFTTPESFINGSYFNNIFHILIRHNGRELVEKIDFFVYESNGVGSGFDTIIFTFSPKPRSVLIADYAAKL